MLPLKVVTNWGVNPPFLDRPSVSWCWLYDSRTDTDTLWYIIVLCIYNVCCIPITYVISQLHTLMTSPLWGLISSSCTHCQGGPEVFNAVFKEAGSVLSPERSGRYISGETPGILKFQRPKDSTFERYCKAAGHGWFSMATLGCQRFFIGHFECGIWGWWEGGCYVEKRPMCWYLIGEALGTG